MFNQVISPTSAWSKAPEVSRPSREIAPNLPVERDATGLPVGFSRECDIELPRKLYSTWIPSIGARELVRPLNPVERLKLEGRSRALEIALLPFEPAEEANVDAEIAAMFSGFRAMRQQGDDVAAVVEVTRRVLREFPYWAIARACLLIAQNQAEIDGKTLDRRYTPNDTEIYAVVSGVVKLRRTALATAQALLTAPIEQPAPRRPAEGPEIAMPERSSRPPREDPIRSGYAARVAADLASRRARQDSAP